MPTKTDNKTNKATDLTAAKLLLITTSLGMTEQGELLEHGFLNKINSDIESIKSSLESITRSMITIDSTRSIERLNAIEPKLEDLTLAMMTISTSKKTYKVIWASAIVFVPVIISLVGEYFAHV